MRRPERSECKDYYWLYIDRVPAAEVLEVLAEGVGNTTALLSRLSAEQETFRYAEGKWSIRQVIGHLVDTERVFAFRALSMARADPAPLPPMDQDPWNDRSNSHRRTLASQLEELDLCRRSHVAMFRSFDDEMWSRRGTASGFGFTVRSLPYIIAGHEIHHRRVLEDRYLSALAEG